MIVPIIAIAVIAVLLMDKKGGGCGGQPGKYFTWAELTKTNHTNVSNKPNTSQCTNIKHFTSTVLDPLREAAGSAIYINSAFRTAAVNIKAGGVANSRHLQGLAADLRSNKYTPQQLESFILGYHIPHRELIVYSDHLHVSL